MQKFIFNNGDSIDLLGFGTWRSSNDDIYQAIRTAIKAGYRHIDCAPVYGNEPEIGRAISDAIYDGEVTREELWITTKLWNSNHKNHLVKPALQKSLEDLNLDYIDLFLIHWPVVFKEGVVFTENADDFLSLGQVPILETWQAMEEVKLDGLARHIGVSNFSVKKLKIIEESVSQLPEVNQIEMHPYLSQEKLLAYANENNILLTAYAPLAAGGAMKDSQGRVGSLLEESVIVQIAEELNATPAQVILAWGLKRETAVIPKSITPKRIISNFEAKNLELTKDQFERINSLNKNFRFYDGKFFALPGSPYNLKNLWD